MKKVAVFILFLLPGCTSGECPSYRLYQLSSAVGYNPLADDIEAAMKGALDVQERWCSMYRQYKKNGNH